MKKAAEPEPSGKDFVKPDMTVDDKQLRAESTPRGEGGHSATAI